MSGNNLLIGHSNFRFTIRNVKQMTTTISSQVHIYGLPWQVKIKKNGEDITIQLCCNNPDKTSNWSCAARAIFKLLSFSCRSELFEQRQDVVAVFNSELTCIGRNKELIKWQDLLDTRKQYVCNNTMMIDVTIQAEKPRDANQSRLIEVEPVSGHATFHFKLLNVKRIIAMDSPEFTYRNMKCQLTVSKRYPLTNDELMKHKEGYLGIWLVAFNYIESAYNVQVIFRLLSHKSDGKHFEKVAENVTPNRFNYSSRLIALCDLYQNLNEYVQNDSIQLEVEIRIVNENASSLQQQRVNKKSSIVMECILCYDNMIDQPISSTPCGHLFCRSCIEESLIMRAACPICNKIVNRDELHDVFLPSIVQSE